MSASEFDFDLAGPPVFLFREKDDRWVGRPLKKKGEHPARGFMKREIGPYLIVIIILTIKGLVFPVCLQAQPAANRPAGIELIVKGPSVCGQKGDGRIALPSPPGQPVQVAPIL